MKRFSVCLSVIFLTCFLLSFSSDAQIPIWYKPDRYGLKIHSAIVDLENDIIYIYGQNFGNYPDVWLNNFPLTVLMSEDEYIEVSIDTDYGPGTYRLAVTKNGASFSHPTWADNFDVTINAVIVEDDPQVGPNTTNYIPKWNGTTLITSSIYDRGDGFIGFGTSNPQAELHVIGGDTPVLRLDQDNTEGWSPQVWDVAGNESNFFIRDVTNSSRLPFRILPGAPTNCLYLDSDGDVGIGTGNPNYPLHMESGAHVTPGGVWTNASSRQFKHNIRELTEEEALNALKDLEPTIFSYKADDEDEYIGFIAEDVPELVATKDRRGLSPMDIVAVLTKVVQQQQEEIEELKVLLGARQ